MFPCSKCNISFDSRNTMMKHMKNKHINEYVKVIETKLKEAEKENSIDVETPKVATASELENNNERFSFSQVKACDKCEAVFLSDTLLKDHINNNHIENIDVEKIDHTSMENIAQKKQLHCAIIDTPECQFQCETNNEMQQHIKVKHRPKPQLQCTVCNLVFRNLDNLATHMNMAHEKSVEADSQHKCRTCQKEFTNNNELNTHIIENHKSYKPCRNFATNNCEYN